jgi:hypothetical protein
MITTSRVTITLPSDLVDEIDRFEKNRSKFVLEGVRREIQRRRREALRQSLHAPHSETVQFADAAFDAWAQSLPAEGGLVDETGGTAVRWIPGRGWVKEA